MAEAPKPQRVRRRRARNTSETKLDIKLTETDKQLTGQTVPNTNAKRRRRQRKRRPVFGPWPQGQGPRRGRLRRAIKREIKREGLDGPRVSVQQRVSSTFGLVGPNSTGNVELELNFFLHPSLAKEANDGTAFGPVQALAAQYALWKLKYLRLIFTPMVGASAVSGTVLRASLNLSQSPGGTNWSGLGTRIHLDIHPGQKAVFTLRGDQIGGPRDGGWWLTDTNEEGSQSAGPIIEVHTLGKTTSTFKDQPWVGPLFIVEGVGLWQFANYQVKPALGMLERRQGESDVTMNANAGQPITMELSNTDTIAQFMMNNEPEIMALSSTSSVGETIFQVVDVGAEIAALFAPPPFGWLLAGGWWFLKRAFSAARSAPDGVPFYVYASLSDAQNNRPAIAGATTTALNPTIKKANLIVTQVNAPNVGPQPAPSAFTRAAVPVPMDFGLFRMHSDMFPEEVVSWVSDDVYYPNAYIVGKLQSNSTEANKKYLKTSWYISVDTGESTTVTKPSNNGGYLHTVYVLHNSNFRTPDGTGEYIPPEPKSGAALYFGSPAEENDNTYNRYGQVVATAHVSSDNPSFLNMVFTLIRATKSMIANKSARNLDIIWAQQSGPDAATRDKIHFSNITVSGSTPVYVTNIGFNAGDYLLGVSYAVGYSESSGKPPGGITTVSGTNVDISVHFPFNSNGTTNATDKFFRLDGLTGTTGPLKIVPYNLSGNIFAASSVDMSLNYVKRPNFDEQNLLTMLKQLNVAFEKEVPEQAPVPEFMKEYLDLLFADGRLPTRSEIAIKDGDYREALRIFRMENPI
nr:MAG: ORF2 [Bat astrovirus]